jgi:predicted DNA-binding ribbon-helix-helix protein
MITTRPALDQDRLPSRVVRRSIFISDRSTNVSLEDEFWVELKRIAKDRGISLSRLVGSIAEERPVNLSSALRLFVLAHYRAKRVDAMMSSKADCRGAAE